jgi:hypothetical protein
MADEINLNHTQPLDPALKGDTYDVGQGLDERLDQRKIFIKQLNEKQREYMLKEKPYDYRGAKIDFEDEQEKLFRQNPRKYKNIVEFVPVKFDFEKYGDSKRFKFVDEKPIEEDKIQDGLRVKIQTGTFRNYTCPTSNSKITVVMKIDKPIRIK